jgi:hypothetical protein
MKPIVLVTRTLDLERSERPLPSRKHARSQTERSASLWSPMTRDVTRPICTEVISRASGSAISARLTPSVGATQIQGLRPATTGSVGSRTAT